MKIHCGEAASLAAAAPSRNLENTKTRNWISEITLEAATAEAERVPGSCDGSSATAATILTPNWCD
jgi:hypothetical protein